MDGLQSLWRRCWVIVARLALQLCNPAVVTRPSAAPMPPRAARRCCAASAPLPAFACSRLRWARPRCRALWASAQAAGVVLVPKQGAAAPWLSASLSMLHVCAHALCPCHFSQDAKPQRGRAEKRALRRCQVGPPAVRCARRFLSRLPTSVAGMAPPAICSTLWAAVMLGLNQCKLPQPWWMPSCLGHRRVQAHTL